MTARVAFHKLLADARGVSAVEFALLAPVAIVLLVGTVAYGLLFSTHVSLQQLVAETTRATVGGLSATERDAIARQHVAHTLPRYRLLHGPSTSVSVEAHGGATEVAIHYDASGHPAYIFEGLLPLPSKSVTYRQVIRDGGA